MEVRDVLRAMIPHVKSCKVELMPIHYEQCLVSLTHTYSQDSTLYIIADILISRIDMFLDTSSHNNKLSLSDK